MELEYSSDQLRAIGLLRYAIIDLALYQGRSEAKLAHLKDNIKVACLECYRIKIPKKAVKLTINCVSEEFAPPKGDDKGRVLA